MQGHESVTVSATGREFDSTQSKEHCILIGSSQRRTSNEASFPERRIYFIPPSGNRTHNRHAYSHTLNLNFIFTAKSKFTSHFYIHYINLVYAIFCSKAISHKHMYVYTCPYILQHKYGTSL